MKRINYTYKIEEAFCSDFMLVHRNELDFTEDLTKDIYNVYAVGGTDANGDEYLILRTRYYFTSNSDNENYLHCMFESHVYIEPDPSPFATNKDFVMTILRLHDQFAIENLNGKKIDSELFPDFAFPIKIQNINYDKHSDIIMAWMKENSGKD